MTKVTIFSVVWSRQRLSADVNLNVYLTILDLQVKVL